MGKNQADESKPMNHREEKREPNKKLAAVCGLYCEACSIYIATHEDSGRLKKLAAAFKITEEEAKCYGCRSDKRLPYCTECRMFACAEKKEIDFCSLCDEYPCSELKRFQSERPHRIELWENLDRIRLTGYQQWLKEMQQHYACPSCRTLNSAYDTKCRKCAKEPSCAYVSKHKDAIVKFYKTRK